MARGDLPQADPARHPRMVARPGRAALTEWQEALVGLPRNAVLRRELRGWRRSSRDWRLWLGLRQPRELREWGLFAVVGFASAPYLVWASVAALRRYDPTVFYPWENEATFGLVVSFLVLYACLVTAVATASSVVGERQR